LGLVRSKTIFEESYLQGGEELLEGVEVFIGNLSRLIDGLEDRIDVDFDAHRLEWKKYLQKDGSGLFVYLKEITTIDLLPVIEKIKLENGLFP